MKKQVIVFLLVAVIVGVIAIYFAVSNHSEPAVVGGNFLVNSTGCTLVTSDHRVTLDVLPNALLFQTNISIGPIQDANMTGYTVVSAYQFGPEDLCFLKPAALNITYNPRTLPSEVNQSDLRIFVQLPAGIAEVENSSVDTKDHVVFGQVYHFSIYYMGVAKNEPTANPVIVGKWDRTDGIDRYTFCADGTTHTIINGIVYNGTWGYDGAGGYKYILNWEHSPPGKASFIDWITIANDGQSYSGHNNYDDSIRCVRVGDKKPVATIQVHSPPYWVEGEITLRSVGSDPDDSASMLTYQWTVTSPYKEVRTWSTRELTFTPHVIGDYIITLKVSDGVLSDSKTIVLTVKPDMILELVNIVQDENMKISFKYELTNYGSEGVFVTPYLRFTDFPERSFEIGPIMPIMEGSAVVPGDTTVTMIGTVSEPLPAGEYKVLSVDSVDCGFRLEANHQTSYYLDRAWAFGQDVEDISDSWHFDIYVPK